MKIAVFRSVNVCVVCEVDTIVLEDPPTSSVPRNFFRGGGSTYSVEDRGRRERGCGGGSPLVRGSGGSCNLVQEISFHIVIFS